MNKKAVVIIAIVIIAIGGLLLWGRSNAGNQAKTLENSGELISDEGIHWHPTLKIVIKGEEIIIPTNIGIGMQYVGHPQYDHMMGMTDMHTHDNSGTLHWEIMEGPVKKEDVKLATFFSVWGETFNSNCVFEFCNDPEGSLTMFVNGKENVELENYLVKDGDKIEIRYE